MNVISGNEEFGEVLTNLRASDAGQWLLPRSALINVLNRFLAGDISAKEIAALADALEMNETVLYEEKHEQIIAEVLFTLSNPEINQLPTSVSIVALIRLLELEV